MKRILINLKLLRIVLRDLDSAISDVDVDKLNDLITDVYPFENSLDEVCYDIYQWTNKIIDKIEIE